MSWPARIKEAGGVRTQFHHMIDIVPTILEATGITAPVMVDGVAQKPIEGVSMAYTWDNAQASSARKTQYFEMFGSRGIYSDGWYACTTPPAAPWLMGTTAMPDVVDGYKWELYNLTEDYSQNNDLAAKMPEKLHQMQELFLMEAAKYDVFPLDNSILERLETPRPSATAGRKEFSYAGVMPGIPTSNAPNVINKSYTITAEVTVPENGGEGMLVTTGGASVDTGSISSRANPYFCTTSSIWSASVGRGRTPFHPASTCWCSISNLTDPAWARAALAS
ncbi:arylsulfatase [Sinorhizobium sp. NFACC03]|nr:arylsulfatase [Sinorhizobium sp. NFACC03]